MEIASEEVAMVPGVRAIAGAGGGTRNDQWQEVPDGVGTRRLVGHLMRVDGHLRKGDPRGRFLRSGPLGGLPMRSEQHQVVHVGAAAVAAMHQVVRANPQM